jgi:hypothetical protein
VFGIYLFVFLTHSLSLPPSLSSSGFDEDVINEWNAQKGQDKFVLEVLGYKRRGYFIELGAFDAIGTRVQMLIPEVQVAAS